MNRQDDGRSWSSSNCRRTLKQWHEIAAEVGGYNDGHRTVRMCSHYFIRNKAGPNRELRCSIVEGKIEGDIRMVRAYKRDGRKAGRVLKMTCDLDVNVEILRIMRRASIWILEADVERLKLLPDNPAVGEDRTRLNIAHMVEAGTKMETKWSDLRKRAKTDPGPAPTVTAGGPQGPETMQTGPMTTPDESLLLASQN